MDTKRVIGKQEDGMGRRREKEMDTESRGEKSKKRIKMSKEDGEGIKHKHERRERKEKRKKDKEKMQRIDKMMKTGYNISVGTRPESSACSRLSVGEENKKHMSEHGGEKKRRDGRESVFNNDRFGKRELTPELARISALTEGPPKTKCDCKKSWFGSSPSCPHSTRTSSTNLNSTSSSSQANPPLLERQDLSTSSCKKQSNPPSLEREDVSKLKAALKAYCEERRPKEDVELEPPVLEPLDPVAFYYDSDGNKVWICPTCGGQDDGSPMIGCDECDAWYHWVCVGMNAAPDEKEDWYCRHCIAKRRERMRGRSKVHKKKTAS